MTEAELEAALAKLAERTTALGPDEIVLLGRAWKLIVRAHLDTVRGLIVPRVPERAVDDVQQNVFLELYRALLGGFPEKGVRVLACTIALRRSQNWRRDNAHDAASTGLPSSGSLKPPSSAPGIENLVALRELWERGGELRSMLSPEHQDVFDLHIVGYASLTEAAEILGVPEGTFKSRALAAKRAVKEAWGKLMRSKGRPPR
jgi:RNA polymerase sigma-70 factor (ECF subfamily)